MTVSLLPEADQAKCGLLFKCTLSPTPCFLSRGAATLLLLPAKKSGLEVMEPHRDALTQVSVEESSFIWVF